MKFALAIYGAPATSQAPQTALHFAKATLAEGHEIVQLFFYQDGVHTASTLCMAPQDEQPLTQQWRAFIHERQLDAIVCIAAAMRRGVVDQAEAKRYELSAHNLDTTFTLSGLGQLIDASVTADRIITFGD
ncbi:sulfurtransferase complex subunit TusD [Candidatus Sororendozoicomonas aggregata]|uniref:sulfurtransferase complex subunit TusD n=1 Tax=Candidatus Sororendozoicomonas aggregata TaxID=3073239 RepID=UPI002ED63BB0